MHNGVNKTQWPIFNAEVGGSEQHAIPQVYRNEIEYDQKAKKQILFPKNSLSKSVINTVAHEKKEDDVSWTDLTKLHDHVREI